MQQPRGEGGWGGGSAAGGEGFAVPGYLGCSTPARAESVPCQTAVGVRRAPCQTPAWLWGTSPPGVARQQGFGPAAGRVLSCLPESHRMGWQPRGAHVGWGCLGGPVGPVRPGSTGLGSGLSLWGLRELQAPGWREMSISEGSSRAAALSPPQAAHLAMQTSQTLLGSLVAAPGGLQ